MTLCALTRVVALKTREQMCQNLNQEHLERTIRGKMIERSLGLSHISAVSYMDHSLSWEHRRGESGDCSYRHLNLDASTNI